MIEHLKELLSMQRALDESIKKQHNVVIDIKKLKIAMLDEIGELTHELKGDWCWWKKTQAPVNKEKVLEELVDVWHFVLSIENHSIYDKCNSQIMNYDFKRLVKDVDYVEIAGDLVNSKIPLFYVMCLTYKLGFDFEDVYEAYKKKNAINYERLNNGY